MTSNLCKTCGEPKRNHPMYFSSSGRALCEKFIPPQQSEDKSDTHKLDKAFQDNVEKSRNQSPQDSQTQKGDGERSLVIKSPEQSFPEGDTLKDKVWNDTLDLDDFKEFLSDLNYYAEKWNWEGSEKINELSGFSKKDLE